MAIFTNNHALVEGVPGVAKTLLVRTLSHVLGCDFARIQFTPDLMPSDITGTNVFDFQNNRFTLVKGPVFTTFLLADEINRAPAKNAGRPAPGHAGAQGHDRPRHDRPARTISPYSPRRTRSSTRARIRCPRPRRTGS